MDPTASNLSVFFIALSTQFQTAYTASPIWANQVAMEVPSNTNLTDYGWMDRLPAMREWVGPRIVNAVATRNRSVVNKDWEETTSIPRNAFMDDQHGLYSFTAQTMGEQAAKLDDQQLAALMQANPTCFDGVAFFGTHPCDIDAGASGPLGTYVNDYPSLALTPSNYGAGRASMIGFIGRDGKPMNSVPSLLVVPPQLEEAARQICDSDFIAPSTFGGSTEVGSTTNIWKGTCKYLVVPELANQPKVWYLLDNRSAVKPFLIQHRSPVNFTYLVNQTDPNVFFNKEFIFGADSRSAYDVTVPFKAVRFGSGL